MRYIPSTNKAKTIDQLAEETRKVLARLHPQRPKEVIWSSSEGRWVASKEAQINE